MKENILLSIVIPVHNGAATIAHLVDELRTILDLENLQIVLVNDGSRDNSHRICYELTLKYPDIITYINLSKNFGEHNAVMSGLNYANGDYVVTMGDDFQNPPQEVPRLVDEAISKQYDAVYAYLKKRKYNWFRNLGSKFNDWVANFLLLKPRNLHLSSFRALL